MQVCEGGWVWVHARRLTVGQPRRVRAGPDFEKNPRSGFQILSRGRFLSENRSLVDFTGLLGVPGHPSSSGATDPILPTQRIPKGRESDFIYAKMGRCWWVYEIFGGRPCTKWFFSKGKIGQRWRIFGFLMGRCWWLYEIFGGRPCTKWLFSKGHSQFENRLDLMMMMMMMMMMISCWGWWCSFSNRYNDDVVMMMRVYRPFPFWNRSSLNTHFVKWYSSNVLSFGIEGLT